jgi:hypothetical protein
VGAAVHLAVRFVAIAGAADLAREVPEPYVTGLFACVEIGITVIIVVTIDIVITIITVVDTNTILEIPNPVGVAGVVAGTGRVRSDRHGGYLRCGRR